MRIIQASLILALSSAVQIGKYDSKKDEASLAEISQQMDQAQRNLEQGSMGQQLGLTKMVSVKMNFKDMQKNLETEINNISKEDGVAEESNQKNVEQEFAQIKGEIKKLHTASGRIVKLEKDFELLDTADAGNGKDEEIDQMPGSLMKVITKNQDAIKKLVADKKKADETKAKAQEEADKKSEESAMMIRNTITPEDLEFNWEAQEAKI